MRDQDEYQRCLGLKGVRKRGIENSPLQGDVTFLNALHVEANRRDGAMAKC